MKKIISVLMMILMAGVMLNSCGNDGENEEGFSLSGTSWKVKEASDNSMVGVVLVFMDNGDVKLSKTVDGWNNPKWTMSTGYNSKGEETYDLIITMDAGNYLAGDFVITGEYVTKGSTTYNERNRAEYSYSWYEKGQDIYNTFTLVYGMTLEKQ